MKNKKKHLKAILVITKSNFGGAQRYVYTLATALAKEHVDVAVAFGGSGLLKEKLTEAGIRTIQIPTLERDVHVLKDFYAFWALIQLFRAEKPDIVHLNSSKIGAIGALAGRLTFIPKIIFTAHAWAFNEDRSWFSKQIIRLLHITTVFLSTTTIAVSKGTAYQISSFPFIKHKIKVIYNGIAASPLLDSKAARREIMSVAPASIPEKSLWIGTISELHKNKGLDFLIQAFKEIAGIHPQATLFVIGEGEERQRLQDMIEEYGLENRVFLVGFITDAKRLLTAFDIFTLTSRTEAFPGVLLEAGLAKRPVVASRVGGIPEIIAPRFSGLLVPPNDAASIVRALEIYINNPEIGSSYAYNLYTKVTTEFTLKKMFEETFALYRD